MSYHLSHETKQETTIFESYRDFNFPILPNNNKIWNDSSGMNIMKLIFYAITLEIFLVSVCIIIFPISRDN